MIIVHEFGHIAGIRFSSDAQVRVSVWPGYELYPMPGENFRRQWPGRGVMVVEAYWTRALPEVFAPIQIVTPLQAERFRKLDESQGFIMFMGSGATSLLSLLCLSLIWLCRPRGILLALLVAGGLLHLDMLTYTVMPVFFDAPHLYFIGGENPEPMVGLIRMGLARELAITLILLNSALQFAWLYVLLKRQRRVNLSIRAPLHEAAS